MLTFLIKRIIELTKINSRKVLEVWLKYKSEDFSVISTPGKTCNVFLKDKTKKDQFEENPDGRM